MDLSYQSLITEDPFIMKVLTDNKLVRELDVFVWMSYMPHLLAILPLLHSNSSTYIR